MFWGGILLFLFMSGRWYAYRQPAFSPHTSSLAINHLFSPAGDPLLGFFVGSSPCGPAIRPALGIPAGADCELIKWQLSLYQQAQTKRPATYKLKWTYGMAQANTTGHVGGGTKGERTGKWTIGRGTPADPQAVVYQLDPDKPATRLTLLKLDDRLLHVLDEKKALMIGNGAWSYTLNQTGH